MRRTITRCSATLLAAILLAGTFLVPAASATEATGSTDSETTTSVRHKKPKIRCHGTVNELTGAPEVDCTWAESTKTNAAVYKIVRRGGGERVIAYRGDTSTTSFTDTDVEFGTRYRYRVVVLNDSGKRIQRSRWNKAFIPGEDFERLSIECAATTDIDRDAEAETDAVANAEDVSITCAWDAATSEDVDSYQLWRRVRGHHRELVAELDTDQLSYTDTVPADAKRVVYAVLAFDADGHIIGRSGITKVRL